MSTSPTLTWEQYQQLPPEKRQRPLTAAEYAALSGQQRAAAGLDEEDGGAPANFSGPVFPNPDHVQPQLDTDNSVPVTRLPNGVSLESGVYRGGAGGDVSNPAAAEVQPAAMQTVGTDFSKKNDQKVDYDALAQQHGGAAAVDYDALAAQHGATGADDDKNKPGWLDKEIQLNDHWDATEQGLQSVARGTRDAAKGTVSLLDPRPKDAEEEEFAKTSVYGIPGAGHFALPLFRTLRSLGHTATDAKQIVAAVHDINQSPDPAGTYAKAAQETAGQGAGQALVALGTEGLVRAPKIIRSAVASPTGEAVGAGVKAGLKKLPAAAIKRIPYVGNVAGDVADAAGTAYRSAKAAKSASAAAPAAEAVEDLEGVTSPQTESAGEIHEQAPPEEAAAPAKTAKPRAPRAKRTVVVDPATGRPEFSDVVEAKQSAAQATPKTEAASSAQSDIAGRMAEQVKQIQQAEKTSAAVKKTGAAPEEDLTPILQRSLDAIKAKKGGVATTAPPAELAKRWGVDESSIADTDANVRGKTAEESQAYIDKLADSYKKGRPVEPVIETRDADNNITSVDGRHRALAAKKAGIERIPVIVRRISVQ